jgi:hypothetical protein
MMMMLGTRKSAFAQARERFGHDNGATGTSWAALSHSSLNSRAARTEVLAQHNMRREWPQAASSPQLMSPNR